MYLFPLVTGIFIALAIKLIYDALNTGRKCKMHAGLNDTVVSMEATLNAVTGSIKTTHDSIMKMLDNIRRENTEARKVAREQRDMMMGKIDILDKRVDACEMDIALIKTGTKCKELKKLDVLLVEDDDMVLKTYKLMFEELGFACYTAQTRDGAERALKSKPFDLMVIDMYLDCDSGVELYEYTKNAYKNMKHIIYSGKPPSEIPTKISNIFLEKPIRINTLQNKINEILN